MPRRMPGWPRRTCCSPPTPSAPRSRHSPRPGPRRSGRLTLDSTLGNAHATLGVVREQYEYDWAGAERELRRAIALDPGYATAHQWYAEYLSATGRDAEARLEAERAVALDPLSAVIRVDQALALARGRHLEEAIGVLQRVLETNPDFMAAHNTLGWVYGAAGRFEDAIAEQEVTVRMSRGRSGMGRLAYAYGRLGQTDTALALTRSLIERFRRQSILPYSIAVGYIGMGDHERALDWLERAAGEHDPNVALYLRTDPVLRLAPAGSPIPAAAASGGIGVKHRMSSDLATRLQAALGDAYRIERELGGGGMSRLFVAEEASLHRRVVVKVLPPPVRQRGERGAVSPGSRGGGAAAAPEHPARPRRRHQGRSHLLHHSVVPGGVAAPSPDPGGTAARGRMRWRSCARWPMPWPTLTPKGSSTATSSRKTCSSWDAMPHSRTSGSHAALSEARTGEPLTETGLAVGTPGYMAPEQAAGERHLDARADVYALAVVGYEMLTGKPPFEGPTAQAVLAAHLTITPLPLSDIRPEVPAGVSEVIARALHKSPVRPVADGGGVRDGLRVEMRRALRPAGRCGGPQV